MDSIRVNSKNTKMVAHRGLSGIEKENTLPAFVAAGNRSYFGIETDVHRTLDGKFVVIHDDDTKRVAGVDFTVEETDFDTLRNVQLIDRDGVADRVDLKIPTLSEYIRTCKRYEKKSVLELKNAFSKEDIGKIIDIIKAEGYIDEVIFISFDFDNLVKVREYLPGQEVQFLFTDFSDEIFENVKNHKFDIDVYYKSLTEEIAGKCHEAGIKINCWTCDTVEEAEKLVGYNVEFITSNILE